MATLKLPFPLEAPDKTTNKGVCDVTEIWDSVNGQWLSTTVIGGGGGGTTYTAGTGIKIESDTISIKAATTSALGGIKVKNSTGSDTETAKYVQLNSSVAFVTLSAASKAAKGIVQLSDSTTVASDVYNDDDTKAVTPKALASAMSTTISSAVATEVSGKFVVTTKAAYDLLTPDANKFYFCTEN